MSDTLTGGCQCGRVRYGVRVDDRGAYLCHCGMCRRATGGAAAALKSVVVADVRWEGTPDWYRSSPIATRPFCRACGTPLGFRYDGAERMDLTVGSFDAPERLVPTSRFAIETALPGWEDTSHLPGRRLADNPATVARWTAAIGRLP